MTTNPMTNLDRALMVAAKAHADVNNHSGSLVSKINNNPSEGLVRNRLENE